MNSVIGNAKRFIAYDIIKKLENKKQFDLHEDLQRILKKREKVKGQRHKVFADSFDAKECVTNRFMYHKLDYMHKNPVSKRWQLAVDFISYPHSSAAFYETGVKRNSMILHVNEVLL